MSTRQKRSRQRATAIGAGVGLVIIFTFIIGLVAPDLGSNTSSNPVVNEPGQTVVPPPDPNPRLEGALPYIHSSGYFQTFRPSGSDWQIQEWIAEANTTYPSVYIQSAKHLAVIHHYVQPGANFESVAALSTNELTDAYFAQQWQQYDQWLETGRTVTDDSVIVNFALALDDIDYLGRDITRLQNGALYVVRLVVPENNPDLLELLEAFVVPNFIGYEDLRPLSQWWPVYVDQELGIILKQSPAQWAVSSGGPGGAVTFEVNTGASGPATRVRLSTTPAEPIDSPEAATAWLDEAEPSATVLALEPVTRQFSSGFQIAYTYRDRSGNEHSNLAVLLNDEEQTLFVATLDREIAGVNWLSVEDLMQVDQELQQSVSAGFAVLPLMARTPSARPTTG